MYCRLYLGVEADAFGGKIIFSGLLNGGALVILLWVYFFTAAHETQERQLSEILLTAAAAATTGSASGAAQGGTTMEEPVAVTPPESEFWIHLTTSLGSLDVVGRWSFAMTSSTIKHIWFRKSTNIKHI